MSTVTAPERPTDGPAFSEDERLRHVRHRADHLKQVNQARRGQMARIRAILDGGPQGAAALLGKDLDDLDEGDRETMPVVNLMLSGTERIAHRLGHLPDLRVDPPHTSDDREGPRARAEKRERIVAAYDENAAGEGVPLAMMMPQVARWLVGYGFVPVLITDRYDPDGHGYPSLELRDPFDCFPSEWGPQQQPRDLAFIRRVPNEALQRLYPEHADKLERRGGQPHGTTNDAGAPPTDGLGASATWEAQHPRGLEVVEYRDKEGCTVAVPERSLILEHLPNPLRSGPAFHVLKRFSFNALTGQFDHVIGLMASMVKVNLMRQIAMEDAVFAETNVHGAPQGAGSYKRGRGAVNYFDHQTRTEKPGQNLPYQIFDHVNDLERQLRTTSRYSAMADGESPTSWATGKGVQELSTGVDNEIREYQTVIGHALVQLDAKRLEWDERRYGDVTKPLIGSYRGESFAETYKPSTHIKRAYRTRRVYGVMAGWDEAEVIVTGLQMMQAGTLSQRTFMENVDGLESVTKEEKRILAERAQSLLLEGLAASAQNPDAPDHQRAVMATVEMLPEGELRAALEKFYTEDGDEMSEEEAAMLEAAEGGGPEPLPSQPPDPSTVLSQLNMDGGTRGGVQTVGQL